MTDTQENSQENLASQLNKCEKEKQEYLEGWKRAKADFINYKKEEAKRFEEAVKYSNESILRDLLAVLDSFDLAQANVSSAAEAKCLVIIKNQLEDVLKKFGLEKIQVIAGKPFDPTYEEAWQEVESVEPAGTVVEEVASGYRLGNKILRPAKVKLSKKQTTIDN